MTFYCDKRERKPRFLTVNSKSFRYRKRRDASIILQKKSTITHTRRLSRFESTLANACLLRRTRGLDICHRHYHHSYARANSPAHTADSHWSIAFYSPSLPRSFVRSLAPAPLPSRNACRSIPLQKNLS